MYATLKKSVPLSLIFLLALTPVLRAQNSNTPAPVPSQFSTAKPGGEQLTQTDTSQVNTNSGKSASTGKSASSAQPTKTRMSTRTKVVIGVSAAAAAVAIGLIVHALTKHPVFTGSTTPRPSA